MLVLLMKHELFLKILIQFYNRKLVAWKVDHIKLFLIFPIITIQRRQFNLLLHHMDQELYRSSSMILNTHFVAKNEANTSDIRWLNEDEIEKRFKTIRVINRTNKK